MEKMKDIVPNVGNKVSIKGIVGLKESEKIKSKCWSRGRLKSVMNHKHVVWCCGKSWWDQWKRVKVIEFAMYV